MAVHFSGVHAPQHYGPRPHSAEESGLEKYSKAVVKHASKSFGGSIITKLEDGHKWAPQELVRQSE